MFIVYLSLEAAHCREGLVLLSSPQKDQKGKSVEMLLCRTRPSRCKSGKTWAAIFLPCCRYTLSLYASVKICYALPLRARPPSFCQLSSEAVLLMGIRKYYLNKKPLKYNFNKYMLFSILLFAGCFLVKAACIFSIVKYSKAA